MGKYRFDKPSKGRYALARQDKLATQASNDKDENDHVRYSSSNDRAIRKGKR